MGDLSVTNLYRKVVSPSMKCRADELKKDTNHIRHVQYRGRSPVSPRRIIAPSSSRSAYSAPGRVESRELALQSSITYGCLNIEQDGHYNFHPTTHFKTTSLPAMPLTKKYALMAPASTRTVPLSVTRHSALSLPEKWPNDKTHQKWLQQEPHSSSFLVLSKKTAGPGNEIASAMSHDRPLFRTQRQRKSAEESAKSECRKLKRKSEIISHRIDKQYYMSGIKMPVKSRWDVDTNDLLRLKLLAHHKQLANYKNMKSLQNELQSARESPGGQTSTPTPDCDKKNGSDNPRGLSPELARGPGETEGKWAEDSKSETSSIDEFDIISTRTRGRRIKLPSNLKQNGHTSDDVGDVKKKDELEENPRDSLQENNNNENEKNDKKLAEDSTEKEGESKESEGEERRKKAEDGLGNKTDIAADVLKQNTENRQKEDQITKPSSAKPRKKVKSIRFKDELNEKSPKKADKTKAKEDGKSDEANQEEQSDDHVNPYMDEWLGVKKKQVDGRYKPGKPPPNRIFISGQISKSKKATAVAKFSEMFLTEIIALQDNQASLDNDATPESKFSIINTKQREAFKSMFDEVDKDKNGSVTLEELKMKMMPTVTRDDIKHFVQVFDLNKDKTVDSREFTAICSLNDRLAGTRTETADGSIALELEKLAQHIVIFKEMYKTMDEDDDNRLDVNEVLIMVSAAMETEMGADLDVARRVLGAARDEFGYIDFIGFMSYIPFFAKLLKNIMAKPLSIAEIEKARDRVKQKELTLKPKISNKKEPKSWEAF